MSELLNTQSNEQSAQSTPNTGDTVNTPSDTSFDQALEQSLSKRDTTRHTDNTPTPPKETKDGEDIAPKEDSNTTVEEPKKDVDDKQNEINRRKMNSRNASRRIRRKRERINLENRIKELEEQLHQYENGEDENSKYQAQRIYDRLQDIQVIQADEAHNDFADRAYEIFDDETYNKFMNDTSRYAKYVNANEPELLSYMDRPYGMILLREWYRRMDMEQGRNEWLRFTQYEKGKALNKLYGDIDDLLNGRIQQDNTPPQQQINDQPTQNSNVPVPGSGRNVSTPVATDDVGLAIQSAFDKRRRR